MSFTIGVRVKDILRGQRSSSSSYYYYCFLICINEIWFNFSSYIYAATTTKIKHLLYVYFFFLPRNTRADVWETLVLPCTCPYPVSCTCPLDIAACITLFSPEDCRRSREAEIADFSLSAAIFCTAYHCYIA